MSNNHGNIRVLVVDDSNFMRKVVKDILSSESGIEVIDTAKDGLEAIEKYRLLKPDVITLDVEMPVMDGISCLKALFDIEPVPVIMLSSFTKTGAEATIEALENGAVDFITKPDDIMDMNSPNLRNELIEKVKMAKTVIGHVKRISSILRKKRKHKIEKSEEINKIVLIGASTGGPKALQSILPLIPGNIPAAFLIVQHMPAGFTKSLAERLNKMSEISVKEAEDCEVIRPGNVYIAPGDYHMMVEKHKDDIFKIRLTKDPPIGRLRPSVDVMMESVSDTGINNIIAVVMTGMGGDGSEGIKKLKVLNKGYIIAQDEDSCTVFGMPKVAIQTGMVDTVLPLDKIAKEIIKMVGV